MAIDPTAPLTPITPAAPAGSHPNTVVLQAVARAALASTVHSPAGLGGTATTEAAPREQGVAQADKASAQDGGHGGVSLSGDNGGTGAAPSKSPPPETRLMRAVRLAAAEAVPRQAGLAPLMADLRAAVDRPETPQEVRRAGDALLARLPRAFELSTAQGLRRAVERSGVFLEARLARGEPSVGVDADLKAALLVFKDVLGGWLARAAPSALDRVHEVQGEPAGPAEGVLGEAVDLAPTSGSSETRRISLDHAEGGPAAVAVVQEPLALASDDEDVEPRFAVFLAPSKPSRPPLAVKAEATAQGFTDFAGIASGGDEAALVSPIANAPLATRGYGAAALDAERPGTPPPPFADGPMAGQRARLSRLPPQAEPEDIVRRLLSGATGALARQDLMQIASLREAHHGPETGEARLNLDVPFVTLQGAAVAQFEIIKDGGARGAAVGRSEQTYRVRVSIDVEPLGPVHALLTLAGERARVSLWAERGETIARLRAAEEPLGAALRQAELTPEIAIHSGAPPVRDASVLGHFVDQAS